MARKLIESKLKQGLPTYIPLPNTLRKKKKTYQHMPIVHIETKSQKPKMLIFEGL